MKEELYGFVRQQNIDLPGISCGYRYEKEGLVVAQIEECVYQELSAQMMEVELPKEQTIDDKGYMEALNCHFLLLIWREQEEERLYFFSDTKRVRALEFLGYLLPEFGLVKGRAKVAAGRIASTILKVQMSDMELQDTLQYFLKMSASYFENSDCIMAGEYGKQQASVICNFPRYVKKRIPWAVVRTTDIARPGSLIRIKSLENESGMEMIANADIYIMVGCRGEVYDIKRDKFERTYDMTDEKLDVFEQMLDFLPEAKLMDGEVYVSLDEFAHLCYPKAGAGIYAKELEKRAKVFPVGDSQEYYLGRPGDYLAVRPDDLCDIYVIQREIFLQTYEEVFCV